MSGKHDNSENLGAYYESILEKEVRKRDGIYYSPSPVVDYIIDETIGKLLKDKTPTEAADIRIIDPACGGGIFLSAAYQFLLDWYEKHCGTLTLEKRMQILNDHIFGIDIDPNAVGITQYCLSKKCSEESKGSIKLAQNIRCGDSLLLDWQSEFSQVFKQGGFDIIIGNPPYSAKYPAKNKEYFKEKYVSTQTSDILENNSIVGKLKGSFDTFSLFIENGFNQLKTNGYLTFIVPLSVISCDSMTALHNVLFNNCQTIKVSSYAKRPLQIFRDSCIANTIFALRRTNTKCERLWTTKMHRLTDREKFVKLLGSLKFADGLHFCLQGRVPKISLPIEKRILKKLFSKRHTPIGNLLAENGKPIFYRSSGGRYYNVVANRSLGSTKEKTLYFDKKIADVVGVVLSSNLFWWYQQVYSNSLDLKAFEVKSFPIPLDALTPSVCRKIERLYNRYLQDIERHVIEHETQEYKNVTKYKEYKIRYSKKLIDKIDDIICPLYGLTEKELEFIKNYEIKFRLDGENKETEEK